MSFTTLQVTSGYSLLQSTIDLEKYVDYAKKIGYQQLVLTDVGVLHGAVQFYNLCQKIGITPIIGCQFLYQSWLDSEKQIPIVIYAKNEQGYHSLIRLSSLYQVSLRFTKEMMNEIQKSAAYLQIVFPQRDSDWVQALQNDSSFSEWQAMVSQRFPDMTIGLGIENASELPKNLTDLQQQIVLPRLLLLPFVRTYYLQPTDDFSWQVLQSIESGEIVSTSRSENSGIYYLHHPERMEAQFAAYLEGQLLQNLEEFVSGLRWTLTLHEPHLPKFPIATGETSESLLRQLCEQSLAKKDLVMPDYQERLEYELAMIHQMGFDDYFLIVWDIMRFAHENDIRTGPGRGSAAGSLVAFLLDITQVDPIRYHLLFERFLNPERYTMPDIDLDFPDNQRDRVLDYVAHKYSAEHVAQIATFGTFGAKQVLRDTCRSLGVTLEQANRWSKAIPNQIGIKLSEAYEQSKVLRDLVSQSSRNELIYQTACKLEGLPRHISTHAAGVVISDQPLVEVVPLVQREHAMPMTQYTMTYVEQIGLLKMDFLGLTNLSILHDAIQLTKQVYQTEIDILKIPLDDEATLRIFQEAKTNGIFQFESDGIRRVLKKLQPSSLEDLTAVNALYRPGPMEQIDVFVKRRHGREQVQYPHPILASILQPTYGVLVYQEQVMQVTSQMAGFSLGESDILRRAIGKKDSSVIEREKQHFITGAVANGISETTAVEVYQYIERFANYGFNRSHALAYSLLAYQLAYLKAHYPIAFYTAVFRSLSDRSKKLQDYRSEVLEQGIQLLKPSVQKSGVSYEATQEGILIGFKAIKGIRRDAIAEIIYNRQQHGLYHDFMDFAFRMGKKYCKEELLEALIDAGAFDEFGVTRETLRQTIPGVVDSVKYHGSNMPLVLNEDMYPKYKQAEELDLLTTLQKEINVLGFSVSAFPTEIYRELYQQGKIQAISGMYESKTVTTIGIVQQIKKIRTKKGEPMAFAQIQDATGTIDLAVFPEEFSTVFRQLIEGALVLVSGRVSKNRQGNWQIQVQKMENQDTLDELLKASSLKCYLRIPVSLQTSEIWRELQQIVQQSPGDTPIYVYLEGQEKLLKGNFSTGIKVYDRTLLQLNRLLNEENVKIVK